MFVNRWSILVRAKLPYVEWANSFEDGGPILSLDDQRSAPTLYLIPEHEGADLHELVDEWYWETRPSGQRTERLTCSTTGSTSSSSPS